MSNYPSGTVTFLFTDIEGSTKLAQEHPDEMSALLARHNELLNQAIKAHSGFVFNVAGDSFAVAFRNASDALHAALDAQQNIQKSEVFKTADFSLRVRIGIHTGAAKLKENSDKPEYEGYATIALAQLYFQLVTAWPMSG